jgi:hypothetical protein
MAAACVTRQALPQEDHVGHDVGAGRRAEGVVGQTHRAQEIRALREEAPHDVAARIHREP